MPDKLSHLQPEQIASLISRYYDGEKVQDLIAEFDIDVRPSALVNTFPPIVHDAIICPYCVNTNLVTKRQSRDAAHHKSPICPKCQHQNYSGCWCQNCQKGAAQRRKLSAENKRTIIQAEYSRDTDYPLVDELHLKDALYLMALTRHSISEDLQFVEPYKGNPDYAPTYKYTNEIVKYLYSHGLLTINRNSPIEAFVFDASETGITAYYPTQVFWEFLPMLDTHEKKRYLQDLEQAVQADWPVKWHADLNEIWREIAKFECIEYFLYLLEQRGYTIDDIGEKTHAVFETLLNDFAVSQIFNLTWQAVRDVTDYNMSNNIPRYRGKNIFIGGVQRKADRAKAEGWEIRHSRRDFKCPQTVLSSTLFNLFLERGNEAFETVIPKPPTPNIAVVS